MHEDIKTRWMELLTVLAGLGLPQERIALEAGVSQAAVSRVTNACPNRNGRAFKKLCIYADSLLAVRQGTLPLPIEEASLVSAIREVWNGTPEHAQALATMIRAAGAAARISRPEVQG